VGVADGVRVVDGVAVLVAPAVGETAAVAVAVALIGRTIVPLVSRVPPYCAVTLSATSRLMLLALTFVERQDLPAGTRTVAGTGRMLGRFEFSETDVPFRGATADRQTVILP
jgi:hypothetical protein